MKQLIYIFILLGAFNLEAQKKQPKDPILFDLSEWTQQIILEDKLEENSGIQWVDGFIYTFNDSGGEPEVYKVDPNSGKIIQTIRFKKVTNIDFEDIAFDGKNLYIGDFGNNKGDRKEKFIYVFNLSKIKEGKQVVELSPRKMIFVIDEENTQNVNGVHTTNYDIESLVYYGGKLHFFTKEWTDAQTTHYTLDLNYSYQPALRKNRFDAQSFITSADISGNTLLMTAYTREGEVFLYRFEDFEGDDFFSGTSQKYMLGLSPAIGQIEGVSIVEDKIFISGENFSNFGLNCPQKIYTLNLEQLP